MVANVSVFVDPAGNVRELPNYIGRRWMVASKLQTMCRQGCVWHYRSVAIGTVLDFAGWAGIDHDEPFAGFTSPDMPGWVVYLPPRKLGQWCREIDPPWKEQKGQAVKVKVRIAGDDCDGEEE